MPNNLSKSEQRRIAEQKRSARPGLPEEQGTLQGGEGASPFSHPDDSRGLPEVKRKDNGPEGQASQGLAATGEEIPGQVPAVKKNRIPVLEVSKIGEKVRP